MPDGVKVSPDGQFLSVALESTDEVWMFSIGAGGALAPVPGSPFASPADGNAAGVDITCASNFLYAAQANVGGTNVDVFSVGANGVAHAGSNIQQSRRWEQLQRGCSSARMTSSFS